MAVRKSSRKVKRSIKLKGRTPSSKRSYVGKSGRLRTLYIFRVGGKTIYALRSKKGGFRRIKASYANKLLSRKSKSKSSFGKKGKRKGARKGKRKSSSKFGKRGRRKGRRSSRGRRSKFGSWVHGGFGNLMSAMGPFPSNN